MSATLFVDGLGATEMNRFAASKTERLIFGTLIVQVLDRITELPAKKVYVGFSTCGPDEASITGCGTLLAYTDEDGRFSFELPAGKWIMALSKDNWHEVWVPVDLSTEITVIHNPGDQIRSRYQL